MKRADKTDFVAVSKNCGGVLRMLPCMDGSYLCELRRAVFNLLEDAVDNLDSLVVEVALALRFREEHNAEMAALVAVTVFECALNNSAYLEYAVAVREVLVLVCRDEQGGKHGVAQNAVVGVLDVEYLDIVLNLDAELLVFLLVAPDVGVNLVHGVFLDEDVLYLVADKSLGRAVNGLEGAAGRGDFKVVVAVDSRYLFDDVRLYRDILRGSPGGDGDGENAVFFVNAEAEQGQRVNNALVAYLDSGVSVNISLVEC